ncbi:hypothetical protein [Parvimonas sp. C2]|uniref:hypothetical protein n=1 Tax=Parvimonas sp. C2 TaxID=3110692 RepID=UPI002B4800A8|nr:hypothetical protein [Parvimonas sp. C2]MEB3073328.1 hypothetical protein [Parvimonas sp. C2]
MDILFLLLKGLIMLPVVWLLMFITIFFHEMGHVVMYVLFYRENNWTVDLGIGNFKLIRIGRFTIYLNMLCGYARCNITKGYNKLSSIMLCSGGFFVNLFFVILLWICLQNIDFGTNNFLRWCVNFLFYSNLFQFLGTIIPMTIGNYSSDGMWVLRNLRGEFDED